MDVERKDCIWFGQCGAGECRDCGDYSPEDDFEAKNGYYCQILRQNVMEYEKMIQDYTDGRAVN